MELTIELNGALHLGLERFKHFINNKLLEDPGYLENPHWIEDGSQVTVLQYLIKQHQEKNIDSTQNNSSNLIEFIGYIIDKTQAKNIGEPLHLAIFLGHVQLALHLLELNVFDINRRDEKGRTLLSLVISIKNRQLLKKILTKMPEINATTKVTDAGVQFQPLHEAIVNNFAYGVRSLGSSGANLSNPIGAVKDTPLILAARLGKIKALEALLDFPINKLNIEAENKKVSEDKNHGDNAIESLCKLLARDQNNNELIRGIAMLLCQGAEPPRNETLCLLLASKRRDLLNEIDDYMNTRPELVDPFVNRCHLTGSVLHQIVYVDHSWSNTVRHLFGKPSETAFIVEKLVTRKYSRDSEDQNERPKLPIAAAVALNADEPPFKLYAEFVRRYSEAYDNQKITNPWSSMRWLIAEGKCSWETVKEYARTHPGSRTRIIYDDMFKNLPKLEVHEAIDQTTQAHPTQLRCT